MVFCGTPSPQQVHEINCFLLSAAISLFIFFPLMVTICTLGTRMLWRHCRDTFLFTQRTQAPETRPRAYDDLLRLRREV